MIDCKCSGYAELEKEIKKIKSVLNLGYIRLSNGYHYKHYENSQTYESAEQKCEEDGGRLSSTMMQDLSVKEEINKLLMLQPSKTWIGDTLFQIKTEKHLSEENISVNQCMELIVADLRINIIPCNYFRNFLCEITL